MFQVASITKSFKEKSVLKGVSFSIEEGDKIALLGNNGAGKSTLFNIIAGQLQADSGTIKTSLDFQRESLGGSLSESVKKSSWMVKKEAGTKVLASQLFLDCRARRSGWVGSTTLISSAFTALLNCAEVGRRNRILTNYRFLSHSLFLFIKKSG